jgi:predicted nucleic acid-binding protein
MQQGSVIDLNIHLALEAARTSSSLGIPMADSIILATARSLDATLWTQDADFAAVEGVRYVEKVRLG